MYVTRDQDMIDAICWRHYGTHDGGVVEAVLDANRHIAMLGPKLPSGVAIDLPPRPKASTTALQELWD